MGSLCFSCQKHHVRSSLYTPKFGIVTEMLGRFQSNPGPNHWKATKTVLCYMQGTEDLMLTYKRSDNLEVVGLLDFDFVGCVDSKKFMAGYIFILVGGSASWKSSNQTLNVASTTQAEYVACFEATGRLYG